PGRAGRRISSDHFSRGTLLVHRAPHRWLRPSPITASNKKSRRGGTPWGVRPRRLTRQRASRHGRVALRLVNRLRKHRSDGAKGKIPEAPHQPPIVRQQKGKASKFFCCARNFGIRYLVAR